MLNRPALRAQHVAALAAKGFTVSPGLPVERGLSKTLDYIRVGTRLLAAKITFLYIAAPAEMISRERIDKSIQLNKLEPVFTPKEKAILAMDRDAARQQHLDASGWALENMVGLAWIFGSNQLTTIGLQMCADANLKSLLSNETPPVTFDLVHWTRARKPRTYDQVAAQEDFFYCWHNAARNIAFNNQPNPTPLAPPVLVGLLQERRQALTFALSESPWDQTDLST